MDYSSKSAGQITPYLRLPRLNRPCVNLSLGLGQAQNLTDLLPYDGHLLLAGTTKMLHYCHPHSKRIELSEDGIETSLIVSCTATVPTPATGLPIKHTSHLGGYGTWKLKLKSQVITSPWISLSMLSRIYLRVLRAPTLNARQTEGFFCLPVPLGTLVRLLRTPGPSHQLDQGKDASWISSGVIWAGDRIE